MPGSRQSKFKYAQEQGRDNRATNFIERIAKLYLLDSGYKRQNLSFDEIKPQRNSAEVSAIFHTIFSTCRMLCVSVLDYLKIFFLGHASRLDRFRQSAALNNRPEKQINLKVLRVYFAVSVSDGAKVAIYARDVEIGQLSFAG